MPRCWKGSAIGIQRLSCGDQWLIGDSSPMRGFRNCKECGQRPVEDIEVVVNWFGELICGVISMSNSPIGDASEPACLAESVD